MKHIIHFQKPSLTYLVPLLVLALCFCGCSSASGSSEAADQRLCISAVYDEDIGITRIPPEELGGNFKEDISYYYLNNVTICIDGEFFPLEAAIRDGKISVEEILAYAQIDARNGICEELYTSKNGLARYTYRYSEFDLITIHDVYETPDGKQYPIFDLILAETGTDVAIRYHDENGNRIDMEDWGLEFALIEATPTSITLQCTQSGGMHIGDLVTTNFYIYRLNGWERAAYADGITDAGDYFEQTTIARNTVSEYTIDWSGIYQPLEKGDYALYLYINDFYEENELHPLMRNFEDHQEFRIDFTIP